jgi:hypothetical protein
MRVSVGEGPTLTEPQDLYCPTAHWYDSIHRPCIDGFAAFDLDVGHMVMLSWIKKLAMLRYVAIMPGGDRRA